ncbi:HemK family protein methyltransferase [bacterium]|nr:HemK family protein methyltransferase [bacterium]
MAYLRRRLGGQPRDGAERAGTLRILDLCTGSGCVALSLKKQLPSAEVWAQDISLETFPYFEANCRSLGLACLREAAPASGDWSGAVCWRSGDLFEQIEGRFDAIAANPPYVGLNGGDGLELQESVKGFEPSRALFGGSDGLDVIKRIIAQAGQYLRQGGALFLEMGAGQGRSCRELMDRAGFADIEIKKDFAGLDRVCSGVFQKDLQSFDKLSKV